MITIDLVHSKIKDIKLWIGSLVIEDYAEASQLLLADPRESIKKLGTSLAKKHQLHHKEIERTSVMWHHELELWHQQGDILIAGIDEVGRGPLVGPVVTAVVVFDGPIPLLGVNDSKKLSEEKREALYESILGSCRAWAIGIVDAEEIDRINILNATKKAMRMAIEAIEMTYTDGDGNPLKPQHLLIDAVKLDDVEIPQTSIIKGDEKSFAIAAASIVAKVTRDRMLKEMAKEYPQFDWENNKGYGTATHVEAIRTYGPTPYHRRSFIKNFME